MRHRFAKACMVLGTALVLAALSLFLWNLYEDYQAGKAADQILERVMDAVSESTDELPDPYGSDMTVTEIDGYGYIGYIAVPDLGLRLPVMSEWDYTRLRIAPCRYAGSVKTDDLVIAAHNYRCHFGEIRTLHIGDEVYFTDMDGAVSCYVVSEIDILQPTEVEEMTSAGFDLTLFTCTYGGQSRVTVRCSRI